MILKHRRAGGHISIKAPLSEIQKERGCSLASIRYSGGKTSPWPTSAKVLDKRLFTWRANILYNSYVSADSKSTNKSLPSRRQKWQTQSTEGSLAFPRPGCVLLSFFYLLKSEGNRSELRGCLCSFAGLAGRKAEGSKPQWKAQEFPLTPMKGGLRSPAYCTG